MSRVAIIGGSGLYHIDGLEVLETLPRETRWGQTSAPIVRGLLDSVEVFFLARHGSPHQIPPHRVNYRANIQALHDAGVDRIIAINAVGGIRHDMGPDVLVVPDQIIDYSWGREHTFFADDLDEVTHIDFTYPYTESLRQQLIITANRKQIQLVDSGVYGCTQGPRLESAAEVSKLERDGVDLVGMTAMPEASLARELGVEYATLALVVNWAAGRSEELITMKDIHRVIDSGMTKVIDIVRGVINPDY